MKYVKQAISAIFTLLLLTLVNITKTNAFQTSLKDSVSFYQKKADKYQKARAFLESNEYLKKIIVIYKNQNETLKYHNTYKKYLTNLVQVQAFDVFHSESTVFIKELANLKVKHNHLLAYLYALLGYVYNVEGNSPKAIQFQQKAIIIWLSAKKQQELASTYLSLSNSYSNVGAFKKSLNYANKSLSIFKKLRDSISIANIYNNISIDLVSQKKYHKALTFAQKSLKLKKEIYTLNHPSLDNSHQAIGLIYVNLKQYDQALNYFNKSLSYRKTKHSDNHPRIASTYLNIANVYQKQGKFNLALKAYQKALSIWEKFKQNIALANLYNSLATLHQQKSNNKGTLLAYQKALVHNSKTFKDSLNISKNPGINQFKNGPLFLTSLQGKASVLFSKGDRLSLEIALQTYQLCDEVIQKSRQQYVRYQDKLALAKISAEVYENALKTCYQLIKKQPTKEQQYTELAFHFSERNKASILREALQEANAKFGLPKDLQEQEQDLKVNLAYYEKQLASAQLGKDSIKVSRFQNKLFELNRQHEKLTQMLETRYPRYYQLKYNTVLASIAEIKKHLPAKALLVEYFTTPNILYAFVVAKNQCKMLALPGGSGFRQVLRKYVRSIKMRKRATEFTKTSYAAYQQLLQPLEAYLKGKDQLIVVGDDLLLSIPFEPLITQKAPDLLASFDKLPFLLHQYSLSYHYSANLMVQPMRQKQNQHRQAFLGFAPVFTKSKTSHTRDNDNGSIRALPYTEKEIDKIIAIFSQNAQQVKAAMHQQATEALFKSIGQQYRFVHLATHSVTNAQHPELAYIQFEPTPNHQDRYNEGRLYANEIYALKLNADLVVLSSCESGSGKIERGEGMMGLNRGFLYAGARNVVYSLWKVNDRPTSEFMIRFYHHLIVGKLPFHKALQRTKQEYIKKHPLKRPHDWAGFLIIGQL